MWLFALVSKCKAKPSGLGLTKKLLMTFVIVKVSNGIKLLLPAIVVEAAVQRDRLGQEMPDRKIGFEI